MGYSLISIISVAPHNFANSSLGFCPSITITLLAPISEAIAVALIPNPPAPCITTLSPNLGLAI